MSLYAKSRLAISLLALALLCPPRDAFAACAIVDDMESYSNWIPEGPHIWDFWSDGWGDCMGSGNDTGCTLNLEGEITLGGIQSMQYDYDNDGIAYSPCTLEQETRDHKWSVTRAEVANLLSRITTDWNIAARNLLSIPFHGTVGNAIEDMWIKLEDTTGGSDKIFYGQNPGEDPNDMAVESWHFWFIDLNDFDVDLTRIHAMSIGIGQEGSTADGGSGTLYFDDISLCPRWYGTIYVNPIATGNNAGTSWQDAFTCLQDALDVAIMGDQIFVAEGTYYPTAASPGMGERHRRFQMKDAVGIYGGFSNTGDPNFQDRNPSKYPTILSGEIGVPGDPNDNCYHVLISASAILDGFTITGGNANGSFGAGKGAGMYIAYANPTVINCTFTGNSASYGGALYNGARDPVMVNCTFSGNSAPHGGSVIYNRYGRPKIVNSILWGSDGTPIHNTERGSVRVTYSHVEGGRSGTGNTQGDPLFLRDPNDGGDGWGVGENDDLGDLRLQPASPCIDTADNASLPPDANFPARILDGDCNDIATVDMGAHEFDFTTLGDTAEDCDVDENDFAILASHWKETPCNQANNFCRLADVDQSGVVDFRDVLILAQNWLTAAK